MDLTRREAVRRLSVLLGGAASASTVSALLAGCEAAPTPGGWAPRALSAPQLRVLDVVVDLIIPSTDTPGAAEAGVSAFIDLLLDRWAEPEERARFLEGLDGLDALMQEVDGRSFLAAGADRQRTTLVRLDEEAVRAREDGVDPLPFFATLKEWTLAGYYTSEVGATTELQWLASPGRYDGDAALEEVGRTWA